MKYFNGAFVCFSVVFFSALQAWADNLKIYQPRVEKGELAAEANLNYDFDHRKDKDNYFSQVVGFEYGVNDWWQVELSGEIEKENGKSDKLTNYKWENIFTPWKPGENWMDVGFYVELEKAAHSGDPDNFETKLLLEKDVNDFMNTANLKLEHEFGPHHDTSWGSGIALQSIYRYDEKFEPGFEYYGDFGTFHDKLSFNSQSHQFGPVAQGKIDHVKYDTGLLLGLSDAAADATIKLNLEYEF
ncbi:MAG: hypothetical protein KDI61_03935 [Alphaproteobacteria bacterium]|nr:hypothetical protein [Alphaproteobacteria bacterium]